ncbi:hypothetical protein DSO57_1009965 [Entomophthora muscae]|uniref:Uncharacterized protein n=1 Tax=Entomophthora muscae TaxID=34485 RepID=A0ACC2UGD1_9FUNG|nr:hypothetical protein DSO57_1009965 [Entomophthora muscae]
MKTKLGLENWHKHLKSFFGVNPRYNTFFEHLKAEQWNVSTKFPDLPANVSYGTQGALDKSPLDISNNKNQSDGNVKLQALSSN